ncbi:MAG: hypothetical protein WBG54_21195, partial [Acidobacteriaceae bacterium]
MRPQFSAFFRAVSEGLKDGRFALLAALALPALLAAQAVSAQAVPREAYGPYNVAFLAAGPGLIEPLAPPPPLDSRYD